MVRILEGSIEGGEMRDGGSPSPPPETHGLGQSATSNAPRSRRRPRPPGTTSRGGGVRGSTGDGTGAFVPALVPIPVPEGVVLRKVAARRFPSPRRSRRRGVPRRRRRLARRLGEKRANFRGVHAELRQRHEGFDDVRIHAQTLFVARHRGSLDPVAAVGVGARASVMGAFARARGWSRTRRARRATREGRRGIVPTYT